MKQAIVDLLSSKKFITALVGVAVALGAHYGLKLDPDLVAAILGVFAVTIAGQGMADQGKEAARIQAESPSSPTNVQNTVVNDKATSEAPA